MSMPDNLELLNINRMKIFPALLDEQGSKRQVVRILILGDGDIRFDGFGDKEFSLTILIEILTEDYGGPFEFDIVKAHRQSTQEPRVRLTGFHFEEGSLKDFDEVWFFGYSNFPATALDQSELRVISKFMERGGGVFATGDHDDLGSALCGQIPRVRSMRRWTAIPDKLALSAFRKDTLRRGFENEYKEPGAERDIVAQELFPIFFPGEGFVGDCPKSYTHFLLSGPEGPIVFLPDHRHEGECLEPENEELNKSYTFDGYTIVEYPSVRGHKEVPKLVARARAMEPHITFQRKSCLPVTRIDSFGAISAYNGHEIGKGRVVTDSSFHHFVNMNLRKFRAAAATDPAGLGKKAYEDIKRYFRNIAEWLALRPLRDDVRDRSLLTARWIYPLNEELMVIKERASINEIGISGLSYLGIVARETLLRFASAPQIVKWASDLIRLEGQENWLPLPDPWIQKRDGSLRDGVSSEAVANIVLGRAIAELALAYPGSEDDYRNSDGVVRVEHEPLRQSISSGVREGALSFGNYLTAFSFRLQTSLQKSSLNFNRPEDSARVSIDQEIKEESMTIFDGTWGFYMGTNEQVNLVITSPATGTPITITPETGARVFANGRINGKSITFLEILPGAEFLCFYGELIFSAPGGGSADRGIIRGGFTKIRLLGTTGTTTLTLDDPGDWTATRPPLT